MDVFNPATGEVTARVAMASSADVEVAVAAARAAFYEWSAISAIKRARVLFKFKELLDEHHDELAALITSEHGEAFSDARGEVTRGREVVEFACGIPHLLKGEFGTASAPASTAGRCGSRSVSAPVLPRSISR